MKLELKHLAPYLPYGLRMSYCFEGLQYLTCTLRDPVGMLGDTARYQQLKPILRPISDLTKEIVHNGRKVVLIDKLTTTGKLQHDLFGLQNAFGLQVIDYAKLLEYHFDIFKLIPAGLAVDANAL